MTYCLGITTNEGLVLASDSRTNAGFDQVNTCRKMFQFVQPGERVFVILTSGSLSISQSVISLLARRFRRGPRPGARQIALRRRANRRRLRSPRLRHRPRVARTRLLQFQRASCSSAARFKARSPVSTSFTRREIRWLRPKTRSISNSASVNTVGRSSTAAFSPRRRSKSPRSTRCSRWTPPCAPM